MAKNISKIQYVKLIDAVWPLIPKGKHKDSLRGRIDKRTLGQFALFIFDDSVREKFLGNEWAPLLVGRNIVLEDYGIDNKGRLIIDGRWGQEKVDFKARSNKGVFYLEEKFNPTQKYCTFKTLNVNSYIKQKAYVLVIMCDDEMVGPDGDPYSNKPLFVPPGTQWFLISPDTLRQIRKDYEKKQFNCDEFGNKGSYRIYKKDYNRYFTIRDWVPVY